MRVDEILLYGFYLVFFLSLVLTYRINKKVAIINFVIALLYSISFFLYLTSANLEGKGGTGFIWAFYLLVVTGGHFLGIITYLISKWLKIPHENTINKKYLLSVILSVVLIVLGVLFRISHWPFGKPILFTGIGLACLTLVFFVVQKIKREKK